jgi:6-phosphogluconolactonase
MTTTRRHFLAASAALPFALRSLAQNTPHWVFIGTDKGEGIYRAPWNPTTGELGKIDLAAPAPRPDFFAMHPKLPVMYTVIEGTGKTAGVSAYRVDPTKAELTLLNTVSSQGDGPCFVSVDSTGQSAFVANYPGGTVAAFGLNPDGSIRPATTNFDCRNNPACGSLGPVHDRQEAPHMHCTTISPHNNFVLTCNLGEDAIEVFPITPSRTSNTILGTPNRITARPGSGPRHVAFHPNGKWVYCVHELDATIDLYDWSAHAHKATMTLRPNSTISTLAMGASLIGNSGCELLISPDGHFVYTCTRGENSISVYTVNPSTGLLTEQQRLKCGGTVPRIITFDPSRRWLLCSNQGSSTITTFAHDPATGRLNEQPKTTEANTPMYTQFL